MQRNLCLWGHAAPPIYIPARQHRDFIPRSGISSMAQPWISSGNAGFHTPARAYFIEHRAAVRPLPPAPISRAPAFLSPPPSIPARQRRDFIPRSGISSGNAGFHTPARAYFIEHRAAVRPLLIPSPRTRARIFSFLCTRSGIFYHRRGHFLSFCVILRLNIAHKTQKFPISGFLCLKFTKFRPDSRV